MSTEYTIVPTINQIDPSLKLHKRECGDLYDFISYAAGIELVNLIQSIQDSDVRQEARELLNEECVNETDLPYLIEILNTVDGGSKWCKANIKTIIDNSLSFNIRLDNISMKYMDFIIDLTSNQSVMKHIRGGKTWTYENVNKFIEWCVLEVEQNKNIRTNYYYLIREYYCGQINPIGIVGIRQVNKQDNKNKNPKYRQKTQETALINYNLDIFISPEYQGYGSGECAIRKCLEEYWIIYPDRQITINIPIDLMNMIHIATKLGAVMEKTFTTGRAKFCKYVITSKTIIYPDDHLYLPPTERRVIISRRNRKK